MVGPPANEPAMVQRVSFRLWQRVLELLKRGEESDEIYNVIVQRHSEVFASGLDGRSINLRRERRILEFFPNRTGLHFGVRHRIHSTVRIEDSADLITREQCCGQLGPGQRCVSMITIRVCLDRMDQIVRIAPICEPP